MSPGNVSRQTSVQVGSPLKQQFTKTELSDFDDAFQSLRKMSQSNLSPYSPDKNASSAMIDLDRTKTGKSAATMRRLHHGPTMEPAPPLRRYPKQWDKPQREKEYLTPALIL